MVGISILYHSPRTAGDMRIAPADAQGRQLTEKKAATYAQQ